MNRTRSLFFIVTEFSVNDSIAEIGKLLVTMSLLITVSGCGGSSGPSTAQSGVWVPTGSMNTARSGALTATLPSGKVLVVGGQDSTSTSIATAELYDPNTGNWTPTGSMSTPRSADTATLLPNGKVLVTGGQDSTGTSTSTAELYDPDTGNWTFTGAMNTPRAGHAAALIGTGPASGMVLVFGGGSVCGACLPLLDSAELYDPGTGTWTWTGSMTIARYWESGQHNAVLSDGRILAVGGMTCCPYGEVNEAETYDQATGAWTPTSPKTTRAIDAVALLKNGQVLVSGGWTGTQPDNKAVPDTESFDPGTGTWTAIATMSIDRFHHSSTALQSDQTLVAGGCEGGWGVCNDLSTAELYDPGSQKWSPTGGMSTARYGHVAILLPGGKVLAAGGYDSSGQALSSAELFQF